MIRIIDQLHEAVLHIKRSCSIADYIDLNRPHTYLIGNMLRSPQRIDEQEFSETLPLHRLIDGQSSKQDNRNIDPRQSLGLLGRKSIACHSVIGDGVVAQNRCVALFSRHVSSGQVTFLKLGGPQLEPVIQIWLTAIERGSIVLARKPFDHPVGLRHFT